MMLEFRYSYNVIGFQGEDIATSIDRLAHLGYDAVEVEGEPETHDPKRIKKLAEDAGLAVGSVCPNFTAERDLSHPDEDVRNAALAYLREVSEFAAELGAPLFIVAPTAYPRVKPVAGPHDEWQWAVEGIGKTGEHAVSLGVVGTATAPTCSTGSTKAPGCGVRRVSLTAGSWPIPFT
jgi:D-psicose/D-tagatose/L-ribulose 3-epimerase